MKLSEAIIIQKLKQKFTLHYRDNMSDELVLERPLFYSPQEPIRSNKVYVALKEDLAEVTGEEIGKILLFVLGEIPEHLRECPGVFPLQNTISPYQVLNQLQQIFDYYDEWERKLENLAKSDGTIQDMLEVSYPIFHNPVLIHSADFFLVGYSSVLDTKHELEGILNTNTLFEYSNEFKNEMRAYATLKPGWTFYIPEYITGVRAMCQNVHIHDRYIYRIALLEQQRRFYGSDEALFSVLAEHLTYAMLHNNVQEDHMGYQLNRVLYDTLCGMEVAENSLAEFGWHQEHTYACLNIKVASLDMENLTVRFICNQLERLIPHSSAFLYNDGIIVFSNLTRAGISLEEILSDLVYFLRDGYLKAGISREFCGISKMKDYVSQARIALETGSRHAPYQWIYRFDDIVLDYMMEQVTGELSEELVACRQILELKKHDAIHQTEYYETVRTYVENHLNAVQSARQLYIHRSTFLYRMEKIEELVHLDLSDSETLLYVMLTIRLLEEKSTI